MFSGRRQPSCDGMSRMMREYHVRFCEGLGVKFPGPTRQEEKFRPPPRHVWSTLNSRHSGRGPPRPVMTHSGSRGSPIRDTLYRKLQPFRHLHDCSGCFRLERWPGGTCTHWKSAALPRRTPEADVDAAMKAVCGCDGTVCKRTRTTTNRFQMQCLTLSIHSVARCIRR